MHPTPRVLSERCSLAVVVAAVTAASLTAAKKSEGCAWVSAELCLCNVLPRGGRMTRQKLVITILFLNDSEVDAE